MESVNGLMNKTGGMIRNNLETFIIIYGGFSHPILIKNILLANY